MTIVHRMPNPGLPYGTQIHRILVHRYCNKNLKKQLFSNCTNGFLSILHVGMHSKVLARVTDGKVVDDKLGLLRIESGLITGQPTFVANNAGRIDDWTGQVNVHIRVNLDGIMTVRGLEFAALVARLWRKRTFERQLQACQQFVGVLNVRVQCVVRVPFFGEGKSVVGNLVLGLQRAEHFAGILVGMAAGRELDARIGLGLAVQLPQTEMVSFAENVASLLAKVRVRWWWCHLNETDNNNKIRKSYFASIIIKSFIS